jgi:arylsulfatase
VPAIAFWPGKIKPGTVTKEITMTMDLMPTYLEIAGVKVPESKANNILDGQTLAPVLFNRRAMPRRALFWRSGSQWAVRRGPWKLVQIENSDLMLFNLDDDIAEQKNLAKARPRLVKELKYLYKQWEKDIGAKKQVAP